MDCRYIIHTRGPKYYEDADPPGSLEKAMRNTIALADENGLTRLAVPAISMGVYGYPAEEAIPILVRVASQMAGVLQNLLEIRFVVVSDELLHLFRRSIEQHVTSADECTPQALVPLRVSRVKESEVRDKLEQFHILTYAEDGFSPLDIHARRLGIDRELVKAFVSEVNDRSAVGSRSFRTQKSALDHYKEILHRYRDGERVTDPSDHADLVSLIERYDPILEDVGEPAKGCGQIGHFERRLNTGTGWSNSGFWVVRQDGTATDFSYIWAVKGLAGDRSKDFYGACREAVALDLVLAKKGAFAEYGDDQGRVECELTGVLVTIDDAHLDHAWPYFSHLVSGFRAARGWSRDIPDGVVSAPADGQTTATFIDTSVADAFRAYHHDQAILRILSRTANLQTASQARRPRVARPVRVT